MNINFSSLRACFGVRAANSTAATEPNQRQGGFRQAVARLCRALFHSKSSPVVPQAVVPQGDPAANLSANQQLFNPEMLKLLLNGLNDKLEPETKARLFVALSMTKAWGDDPDPLIRFANAQTVESLPEPADIFAKLKEAEPGPQAFQRMLGLIQKKFYPMIDRVLDKPDVAAQVSAWLSKALGDGESLPKVTLLTQLDAPMLQQLTRLLDSLATGSALPTTPHVQALVLVKKAQLIQALLKDSRLERPINTSLYDQLTDEQKNDKDIAIAVLSKAPSILEKLSLTTRADKDVVMAAVKADGNVLAHASAELKADRDVVLHAVSNTGKALQYAPDELRADPEIVLQACKKYELYLRSPRPLEYASDSLKNDRSFVLKLMGQSGACLMDVKPQFQDDLEVVKAAVSNNGEALAYASETLRGTESIVKLAVSADTDRSVNALRYASEELKDNKEVVLLAVKNSLHAFKFASGRLQQDKEILIAAASKMPFYEIDAINPDAKNDDDVMTAAVLNSTTAFRSASEALRNDKELVMASVRETTDAGAYIPMKFRDDKDVMMVAVTTEGSNLSYASQRLKDDKELVLAAVKSTASFAGDVKKHAMKRFGEDFAAMMARHPHKNVLRHASPILRADKEVALAAIETFPLQIASVLDPKGILRSDKDIARTVFSAPKYPGEFDIYGNRVSRFKHLSDNFRKDKAFVLEAVSKDGRHLEHVDKKLKNDKDVVKAAYVQNPESFKYASNSLKSNPAFLKEIYAESLKYKNTAG